MKLKKKQRKEIDRYVRHCADEMGLRDWTFRVDLNVSESDLRAVDDHDGGSDVWGASCDPIRGRKYATIALGREMIGRLLDGELEEFRQTIIHELAHCHLTPLWEQIRLDLLGNNLMALSAYDVFMASAERNLEYAVDAFADAIAPRMPIIELPE